MSKQKITTLDTKSVFQTDMTEKYYARNLKARNPLKHFRDANVIVDSVINGRRGRVESSMEYLSPNIANLTKSMTDVLPFYEFIKLIGIDEKRLQNNLSRMASKPLDIVFIGYGGMSINVLSFMRMMSHIHYDMQIMKQLVVYEPDKLSLTNLFRVYKDCSKLEGDVKNPISKLQLFTEKRLANHSNFAEVYFTQKTLDDWDDDTIFIGAPDFATRELLKNRRFLFVGHSDNEVSITYQPATEHDMTIETYGKIDVRILWTNLLMATDALVSILANNNFDIPPNTELFEYNAYELGDRPQRATKTDSPHTF